MISMLAVFVTACTSGTPATGLSSQEDSGAVPTRVAPVEPIVMALTPADRAADVAPGEPVTVRTTNGTLGEVRLTGQDGRQVSGQFSRDGVSWQSSEPLGYGKTYTTTATGRGIDGGTTTVTSTFTTVRPARQVALSMNPLNGQTVGVGQPLAFYFSAAVPDRAAVERAIRIDTEPVVEGAFRWFNDKEVHWRPRDFWRSGTKVTVNATIYGKNLGNNGYGKEDRTATITIGDKVVVRADGGSRQMTVEVNDQPVRTIPISMGKPGHETPTGTYVVMTEQRDYTMDSSTYGVPADSAGGYRTKVDVASRMSNSGIFYHSAPWSVRDQGSRNVSHGCINMSTENARWMQQIGNKGDIIIVENSGGAPLESWDGFGDWQIPWEQWIAGGKG